MLDIRFIRENPELVRENIRKKFQDKKLPLVDEVLELDEKLRAAQDRGERASRQPQRPFQEDRHADGTGEEGPRQGRRRPRTSRRRSTREADASGRAGETRGRSTRRRSCAKRHDGHPADDRPERSHRPGRQLQRRGAALRRADWCRILRSPTTRRSWSASTASTWTPRGRVSGNGFYYLMGDIARLHEAVLAYARDFMIDKGFTYCIPPFMIHGDVVRGRHELRPRWTP